MKNLRTVAVTLLICLGIAGTAYVAPLTRDNVKGVVVTMNEELGTVSVQEHVTGLIYEIVLSSDDLAVAEVGMNASVNYRVDETGLLVSEGVSFFPPVSEEFLDAQAVLPDEVLSGNIAEADNSTRQDTNTGTGIKTGHIANGAVTTAKIRNKAVTTAKIRSGAVTRSKIAAGAIIDTKITGPISGTKIDPTNLSADLLDDLHAYQIIEAATANTVTHSELDQRLWITNVVINTELNARISEATANTVTHAELDQRLWITNLVINTELNGHYARLDRPNLFLPNDSNRTGIAVYAAPGQTAPLQEWRTPGGTGVASVDAQGTMVATRFVGDGSGLTGITAGMPAVHAANGEFIGWQAALVNNLAFMNVFNPVIQRSINITIDQGEWNAPPPPPPLNHGFVFPRLTEYYLDANGQAYITRMMLGQVVGPLDCDGNERLMLTDNILSQFQPVSRTVVGFSSCTTYTAPPDFTLVGVKVTFMSPEDLPFAYPIPYPVSYQWPAN